MAAGEIHVGDIGTLFELTVYDGVNVVNVSAATKKEIVFSKPDGSTITKTAAFKTDGSDGILTYETIANDLDQAGPWKHQAKVAIGDWDGSSDITKFKVYANL